MGIMTSLSVCIPTYNRAVHLISALRSLQSALSDGDFFDQIEVCVSDNASQDYTLQALAEIASGFPELRLRYRSNDQNLGFGPNLWNVVDFANSDYVLLMGDDDSFDGQMLGEICSVLDAEEPDLLLLNSEPGHRVGLSNVAFIKSACRIGCLSQYLSDLGVFHASFIGNLIFRRSCWLSTPRGSFIANSAYPHMVPVLNSLNNGKVLFMPLSLVQSSDTQRNWRKMQPIFTSIDIARVYSRFGLPFARVSFLVRIRLVCFLARSFPQAWISVIRHEVPYTPSNPYRSLGFRNVISIYISLLFPKRAKACRLSIELAPVCNFKVTVAMLGARMHYALPRLLNEAGLLDRFFTDSYIGNKPILEFVLRLIPNRLCPAFLQRWLGRKEDSIPPEKVTCFEQLGLWYGFSRIRLRGSADLVSLFISVSQKFTRMICKSGLGDAHVVWGFNSASLELFETAKRQHKICVLEQTILPFVLERRLLMQEQARWPGWELNPSDLSNPSMLDQREQAEWNLADIIVMGSDFVRDGLIELGVPKKKLMVIPYGVDSLCNQSLIIKVSPPSEESRCLKVLFAGQVGLRKGVPDLLEAICHFDPSQIHLRLAGSISLRKEKLQKYSSHAEFLGIVPRSLMHSLFQWADLFVLPTIVEGSATVIYEAIMSGCPVISTPNAGSLVQDGINGFIVPIRRPDEIAGALRRYIDEPSLLVAHQLATANLRKLVSIDRYKADVLDLLHHIDNKYVSH